MKPIELTEETFATAVLQSELPVLVDFWAEWCAPCHMVSRWVAQIADDFAGQLRVAKVDVDQEMPLAQSYGLRSVPALLYFYKGQLIRQQLDEIDEAGLRAQINEVLAQLPQRY